MSGGRPESPIVPVARHPRLQGFEDALVGILQGGGNLRVPGRFGAHLEVQRRIHHRRVPGEPQAVCLQDARSKVRRRVQLLDLRAPILQLAFDDGPDDCALVLEIPVHEAGAHLRRCSDVRHAGRVKAVLDEALLRRAEDPLALYLGARRVLARADGVPDHGPRSSQPPPSALYRVTRFDCSNWRVTISACCAR